MDKQPQLPDDRILVDWLAMETQQYTRALIDGANDASLNRHRVVIETLIAEIRRRKKEDLIPAEVFLNLPPNDFFEVTP